MRIYHYFEVESNVMKIYTNKINESGYRYNDEWHHIIMT